MRSHVVAVLVAVALSTGCDGGATPSGPTFTDATRTAGLDVSPGERRFAPDCLNDEPHTPEPGDDCIPEASVGGAAAGDFDSDGHVDLFIAREHAPAALYRNLGDGTFVDEASARGVALDQLTSGGTFADVDRDGDQDLYVTTVGDTRYYLFINDGTGHFSEDAVARGAALESSVIHNGTTASFGDYDADGDLDCYVGEWHRGNAGASAVSYARLLRNLGPAMPGYFEDVTAATGTGMDDIWRLSGAIPGTYSFGGAFVDLDGDGVRDLAVAGDFGTSRMFWGRGDGTFLDGTDDASIGVNLNGMGSTFGDYDGDGDLDWYVTGNLPHGNFLYRNEGGRRFSDATPETHVGETGWGWGAAFFDYDNDGDLDLAATSGWPFQSFIRRPRTHLFRNDGPGRPFADVAGAMTDDDEGRGMLTLDYDEDGDLDVLVVGFGAAPVLYRNDGGNEAGWLRVRLVAHRSPPDGVHALVTVRASAGGPVQMREMGASTHYMGESEHVAHFGLGPGDDPVAEVHVRWPMGGGEQTLTDVPRNQTIVVEEPE